MLSYQTFQQQAVVFSQKALINLVHCVVHPLCVTDIQWISFKNTFLFISSNTHLFPVWFYCASALSGIHLFFVCTNVQLKPVPV